VRELNGSVGSSGVVGGQNEASQIIGAVSPAARPMPRTTPVMMLGSAVGIITRLMGLKLCCAEGIASLYLAFRHGP